MGCEDGDDCGGGVGDDFYGVNIYYVDDVVGGVVVGGECVVGGGEDVCVGCVLCVEWCVYG